MKILVLLSLFYFGFASASSLLRSSTDLDTKPNLKVSKVLSAYFTGSYASIRCIGSNIRDKIEWVSPSGMIVKDMTDESADPRYFVIRNGTAERAVARLVFFELKMEDNGNWTCKSGDIHQTREIVVGVKAQIFPRYEELQANEGEKVTLKCLANGDPTPTVWWYKDLDKQAKQNNNIIQSIQDDDKYNVIKNGDEHILEIKKLTLEDASEYKCRATQEKLDTFIDKDIQLSVKRGEPNNINYN